MTLWENAIFSGKSSTYIITFTLLEELILAGKYIGLDSEGAQFSENSTFDFSEALNFLNTRRAKFTYR